LNEIVFFSSLVTWLPDSSGSYDYRTVSTGGISPNFRNLNEFSAADICPF